ncbi:MAG: dolichyl-phosphate-mannose--protein mannosyltransferase, partial [Nocardioidaceae bacterium]
MSTTAPRDGLRTIGLSRTADGREVPTARRRMVPAVPRHDRLVGWAVTVAITLLAAFLRFLHLGRAHAFLFDETYYAKDAWSLVHHGFVTNYVDNANDKILAGQVHGLFTDTPSMVVHPEMGKWLIGLGELIFGMNPTGWRVASAVVGSLMVFVMVRIARRLTGSTLLGAVAGLLLCFDGLEFVLSRLALLDIFMAFFMLAAVSCLLADRDWGRLRLARLVPSGYRTTASDWGPVRPMLWRPWRLAAGVLFGLACGTKWDAVFPLAAFGVLVWLWDAGARRAFGVRHARLRAALVDAVPAFFYLVVVALVVYVATWTGWLLHAHVYETSLSDTQYGPYWGDYLKQHTHGFFPELVRSLRSLWNYHQDVYTFHTQFLNDAHHTYQSKPQGWLVLNRPVGVEADLGIKPGEQGCYAPAGSTCLRQVLLLGTPALWWGGVLALVYGLYAWLARRDWRFGFALVGVLSTWLPWIRYDERPIFSYYAIAIIPFTILAVVLTLGVAMGGRDASYRRRMWGTALSGAFVVLVIVN